MGRKLALSFSIAAAAAVVVFCLQGESAFLWHSAESAPAGATQHQDYAARESSPAADGQTQQSTRVDAAAAKTAPAGRIISGRVLAADGKPLLWSATVRALPVLRGLDATDASNARPTIAAETDPADATFRMAGLTEGPWDFSVSTLTKECPAGIVWIDFSNAAPLEIRTTLGNDATPTLDIAVFAEQIENAKVTVTSSAGTRTQQFTKDNVFSELSSGKFASESQTIRYEQSHSFHYEGSGLSFLFQDLGRGTVTVRASCPNTKEWTWQGVVARNTRLEARLSNIEPTGLIRARVHNATNKRPIAGARVTLHAFAPGSIDAVTSRFDAPPSSERGTYEATGVPARRLIVEATAPGFNPAAVTLDPTLDTNTRTAEIALQPLPLIAGTLVGPDGRTPERGVYVYIWVPKDDADTNKNGAFLAYTRSLDDGTFWIPVPRAATYDVCADWGCGVAAGSGRLEHDGIQQITGIVIRKPPHLRLKGRVRATANTNFSGMRIFAWAADERWQYVRWARIARDGSFVLEPMAPGPIELAVQLPCETLPWGEEVPSPELTFLADRGMGVPIGSAVVGAFADTTIELDAGPKLESFVEIVVTRDGRPAPNLFVRGRGAKGTTVFAALAPTGSDGHARLGPLPAGEAKIWIEPADQSWRWQESRAVSVIEGAAEWTRVDVPLHEHEIWFEDENGAPLRNATIRATQLGAPKFLSVTTDEFGKATLMFPPGRVVLTGGDRASGNSPVLEWAASMARTTVKL